MATAGSEQAPAGDAYGATIQLGETRLVRTDLHDRMKAMSESKDLMMVCKDFHGCTLNAVNGEYEKGVLQVSAENVSVGYWMPESEWIEIRPGSHISVGEHTLVRTDTPERLQNMATNSKQLHVINTDWHGYQLMADEGDISRGLLMVNRDNAAIGFWMHKSQYDELYKPE